jgi:predicted secreted acid phosphatase
MPTVCIIDIDTTLANNDHRALVLKRDLQGKVTQESWDAFLQADLMLLDKPQEHAKSVVDYMRNHGYMIVFLTGRNEKHLGVTQAWLRTHMGRTDDEILLMRSAEYSGQPASVFKEEKFLQFIQEHNLQDASFLFFEDDKHVLAMWRKHGLVFQCPEAWQWLNPEIPEAEELAWSR